MHCCNVCNDEWLMTSHTSIAVKLLYSNCIILNVLIIAQHILGGTFYFLCVINNYKRS